MQHSNKWLIVSSTNRNEAVTLQLAHFYSNLLNQSQIDNEIIDLKSLPEDFITSALYEMAGSNEAFNVFREKMAMAQKFIFVVPEYNGSFPGVLKAYIDGLKFPDTFKGKKCALVGLSAGIQGGGLALSHLTDIFNYCGMHVLARKPKLSKIEDSLNDGVLTNPSYVNQLQKQIQEFKEF